MENDLIYLHFIGSGLNFYSRDYSKKNYFFQELLFYFFDYFALHSLYSPNFVAFVSI
jgi:hypothetical protein